MTLTAKIGLSCGTDKLGMYQMKVINEYLELLNEGALEYAETVLNSKETRKRIFNYLKQERQIELELNKQKNKYSFEWTPEEYAMDAIDAIHSRVKTNIYNKTPDDIQEKEKALCWIWLKNQALKTHEEFNKFLGSTEQEEYKTNLERFFQFKRFIPTEKRDLNNIQDLDELISIIDDVEPLYLADQEKRSFKDAPQGTEKLYEDDHWQIFAAHNKGAACELGKGTSWCTAAPRFGLVFKIL